MSDDLIRDQLLTMLIAGHDTSTALLSWTLFLLGAHPETMAEARAQVNEVMPDPAVPPSIEQLNRLDVLDRIVSESLRLYPPIHIGNRRVIENETVLEYNVPQDTRVMYSIFLSHHDPQYWDNPETFCPARFRQ